MLRHSSTTTPGDPQETLPNGYPDEWAELAEITGYVPEPLPGKPKAPLTAPPLQDDPKPVALAPGSNGNEPEQSALLDDDDLRESEASAAQTKTPLWSDPFAKGAFVSTLMAMAVGSVGLFLWGINGNWNHQAQKPQASTPTAQTPPPIDPQQAEISRLKTVAALGKQAQTLQQKANQVSPSPTPFATAKASPTRASRSTPPAESDAPTLPVAYTPSRSYIPASQPPMLPSRSLTSPAMQAPVDPTQAWQQVLAAGSYGQVSSNAQPAAAQPSAQPAKDQKTVAATPDVAAQLISNQQTRYDADAAAILSGVPSRMVNVVPGTTATATLSTPVVWAQDLKANQQPQRFGLQLTQPLLAGDGSVALPVGTQMVAEVNTISDSGMVALAIVAVVAPSNHGNELMNVPIGAILLAGEGGKPLMAENYNHDRHRLASMDAQVALMGALGQVGTLLNRPSNESTTTSPYLSSTSVTNGSTNVLGGLLQGGFNALLGQVQQRQQQEIHNILQRPNVWYVPTGQPLQVFVNSSFQVSK